ncbi:glycine betaine ABC transporter substrate-binding protein [Ammoniphilus resinae]|uniref:Glycine betaine/proline transport system substrate-binding protein n=1 Tax=Ammoniphilus resinae TaxID=861532 RepID=A0ABS4GSC1_9BACL|nr:glycine betaine ABC transporter substrate-binding protein [Ammoniphilus resinae]MBP1933178.1 glycine betaine/proline transport system substrate-binding protein [Ammoniphilus resinae]
MKDFMRNSILLLLSAVLILSGCSNSTESNQKESASENTKSAEASNDENKEVVFGMAAWTSTEAPTNIAKLILEEAGYKVEFKRVEQPLIFSGLKNQDIDFFMDAWLPYTEAELWGKYKDDLVKVATSYEEAPLGWVVPTYVEENSIEELRGKAEKFDGKIVGLGEGSGMTPTSKQMIKDYHLTGFEYISSSEVAMLTEAKRKMEKEEPVIFLAWRPHSIFAQHNLKFLEDPKGNFKADNVYVISYKGIEKKHPEAYNILSKWSIDIADLEEMMLKFENDGTSFEDLAKEWIEEHREQVNQMLGK